MILLKISNGLNLLQLLNKTFIQFIFQTIFRPAVKFIFAVSLMVMSFFPAVVNALDVDDSILKLISDSIRIELSHNPGLRDPQDNLPLAVDHVNIEVLALSVQMAGLNSTLFTYQVLIPFETVSGVAGELMCYASYTDSGDEKKAHRATCHIHLPINFYGDDESEVILIDEP